jgi:hypothetical protein
MPREASAQREKQDQSIKARKNELFVGEQVEEQTGPRRTLRDYLKDTPAAPLSKNEKLSLWGSAVPVVLLLVAALLSQGNRSVAKAPTEMIIPSRAMPPASPSLASRSDEKPPAPAGEAKAEQKKDEASAKSDKPPQKKPTNKKKKGKSKPKDTAVVQNTEGEKATGNESKDKTDDQGTDNKGGDSKKKPNNASSDSGSKSKSGAGKDDKGKSATPTPPKKRAAPILVKPKKAYNPAYPKPDREKKTDADSDLGIP